jgi:hypothetical protein
VKAYIFMAYLALFRHNAWGPDATISGTWWLRFVQSPLPWLLAAAGFVFLFRRWRESNVLIPFAVFSVLMACAIFPVKTDMARYTLPLWPGLVLLAAFSTGLVLANWKPAARITATALLCIVMLASAWPSLRARLPRRNLRCEAMLALIRDRHLTAATLLVPHEDVPMLHYYFPEAKLKHYEDVATIPGVIRTGVVQGVIDRGDPPRFMPVQP